MNIIFYDVFDTCITRLLDDPNDVFYLLSDEIKFKHKHRFGRDELYCARLQAATLAQSRRLGHEIKLEEIWQIMGDLLNDSKIANCWDAELDAERKVVVPIVERLQEAREFYKKGQKIIYVSDTYLPCWFIAELLKKNGYPIEKTKLYTSCEIGHRKESGVLFKNIIKEEKLDPRLIIHTGDNKYSDGAVPKSLGIKTKLRSIEMPIGSRSDLFANIALPRLLESGVKSQQRKLELITNKCGESVETGPLITELIGPVLTAFCSWALKNAEDRALKRLYFISRDARLTYVIAKVFSKSVTNIDCRYLYISRQAVFLPSASDVTPDQMPWLIRYFEKDNLKKFLDKLEVPWEIFESACSDDNPLRNSCVLIDRNEIIRNLWEILNSPKIKEYLIERIIQRRSAALAYFEKMGLFDNVLWGIVDIGWHAQCQLSLTKLLRYKKEDIITYGFYLGLDFRRILSNENIFVESLFQRSKLLYGTSNNEIIFKNALLWEHIFGIADHPWVKGYIFESGQGIPEFGEPKIDDKQLKLFKSIELGVKAYAEACLPYFHEMQSSCNAKAIIFRCLDRAIKDPKPQLINPYKNNVATKDQINKEKVYLIEPFNLIDVFLQMIPYRIKSILKIKMPIRLWEAGSLSVSNPFISFMYLIGNRAKIILKTICRRVFN